MKYVIYVFPPGTNEFEASASFCGLDTVIFKYSELDDCDLDNIDGCSVFRLGLLGLSMPLDPPESLLCNGLLTYELLGEVGVLRGGDGGEKRESESAGVVVIGVVRGWWESEERVVMALL